MSFFSRSSTHFDPGSFTTMRLARHLHGFVHSSDSSATSRAQRASARHLNGTTTPSGSNDIPAPSSSQQMVDSDPFTVPLDADELSISLSKPSISRSNSAMNLQESSSSTNANGTLKGTRKDKGKGKDKEIVISRIKEEPQTVSLSSLDPPSTLVSLQLLSFRLPWPNFAQLNEDHCSACRSLGALVYCDGCPRAYHLWCLDPPIEDVDLPEGDGRWFCPSCTIRKVSAEILWMVT
jgi:hypothetical protein